MHLTIDHLPTAPSREQACDLLERAAMAYWLPVLDALQSALSLGDGQWQRVADGSNALFAWGETAILKLVPPNWCQQGEKERLLTPLLDGQLSLQTPRLIGSGRIDNWVFVLVTRLNGVSLATAWPDLSVAQKRPLLRQVGQLLRELRELPVAAMAPIHVQWASYITHLIDTCMARHRRMDIPAMRGQRSGAWEATVPGHGRPVSGARLNVELAV